MSVETVTSSLILVEHQQRVDQLLVLTEKKLELRVVDQILVQDQWNDSLPDDWLAKLPAEVIVEDDNIRPPTVKLAPVDQELVIPTPDEEEEEASVTPEPAPVDQGLVLPTPDEEEEEASVSPELTMTDRLLQLLEEDIIRRMKKRVQDLVIPEWKVKLVQSYNWP